MTGHLESFRAAIVGAGLTAPEQIVADGQLHRFASNGRRGDDAGWYALHLDGIAAGAFGCWRSGLQSTWKADGPKLSKEDAAKQRAVLAELRKQRDAEERVGHEQAAAKAMVIWAAAQPATPEHGYLRRKGIGAHGVRAIGGGSCAGWLAVPMRDAGGRLWNIERIAPEKPVDGNADKKGLFKGKRIGCYFSIGTVKGAAALLICEGFATGASLHEATGLPVAVAFNAGNLEAVTKALRKKFPDLPMLICSDDDHGTAGNPGRSSAQRAARAIGAGMVVPVFAGERADGQTDFNDLHQSEGPEAVRRIVMGAVDALRGGNIGPQGAADAADDANPQPTEENAPAGDSDEERIARLAALSSLQYDRIRKAEAEAMGVRPATLDKLVAQTRRADDDGMEFDDVEPWPDPVAGAALLSEIAATVRRFIICDKEVADATALWAALTWFVDAVQVAPLAVVTAPEKRCGKSQLLFLLGRFVCRPLTASNVSAAALFRAVDAWRPTLLVDEADAFMRENEELRGILNAGHTRDSAYVVRVVGEELKPQRFSVWGCKALAGIGHLADTLMDRAIVLELRRKLPHENVDRLRHAEPGLLDALVAKLARFADDNRDAVRRARPDLPAALHDRAQDNWEPLLAIADVAGDVWPELARQAALKLSGGDSPTMTTGTELLADVQAVFTAKCVDRIGTADLIEALCSDQEAPWATYNRGKPISPRQVSKKLADYGVTSQTIRIGLNTLKGYLLKSFDEVFSRYLPFPPPVSVTPSQTAPDGRLRVTDRETRFGNKNQSVTPKPALHGLCDGVTDTGGDSGGIEKIEVTI